jgi:hypothetical protein
MGTALIYILIHIWLGMAAAMITVLQVSYSRASTPEPTKNDLCMIGKMFQPPRALKLIAD